MTIVQAIEFRTKVVKMISTIKASNPKGNYSFVEINNNAADSLEHLEMLRDSLSIWIMKQQDKESK